MSIPQPIPSSFLRNNGINGFQAAWRKEREMEQAVLLGELSVSSLIALPASVHLCFQNHLLCRHLPWDLPPLFSERGQRRLSSSCDPRACHQPHECGRSEERHTLCTLLFTFGASIGHCQCTNCHDNISESSSSYHFDLYISPLRLADSFAPPRLSSLP